MGFFGGGGSGRQRVGLRATEILLEDNRKRWKGSGDKINKAAIL